ncbi:MAG: tetratricopeptide repeat protein [Anaerolineales bacterium]|nr:tetratricopeptide repeat protein [Anaerolineales bacterium]
MNISAVLLLVGCAYVVFVNGLSWLRREGLSLQLTLETIIFTGLVSGLTALTDFNVHPVLFLLVLYLVTMRVRLLVDAGTVLARSGRLSLAERLYQFAMRLWPDETGKLVILVNQSTALVQQGRLDEAIAVFRSVLEKSNQGYLGVKYESAAHYNLGVAYLRKNLEAPAAVEFNAVLDTWPASEYARRATSALEQRRRKNMPAPDPEKQ